MADEFAFTTGHTWADFLATRTNVHGPAPAESLTTAEDVRRWLDAVGLAPDHAPRPDDLALVHEVREALRAVVLTRLGHPLPPRSPDLAAATAALRRSTATAEHDPVTAPNSCAAALSRIVTSATVDLGHPALRFLTCAEPVCGKVFSDRGDTRQRYCTPRCATRARVRSHRGKSS
ncbi:ABATE domain-containing protein [Umezawaea endophytica]|uniref:ABATE domain-containing protein n=1 Tax=Umezawaea endophytica TaxID=1654476 RepID=A0A9X3ADD5_9PSEU|nr:ABATE domain-containing protein [Umezawaea endophytica]MCS7475576.1 ABATE domain-containing protein [Umezawaea endophytica]